MTASKSAQDPFKPKLTPETKHDATNLAARAIIAAEDLQRQEKTARLRMARLQVEAADAAAAKRKGPASKPPARKAAKRTG